MKARIAIVGAGINGLLIAKACARRGVRVELFDAGAIPNSAGLSCVEGRLWRYIHPENPRLQALARQSLPAWKSMILEAGTLYGRVSPTIRIVSDNEIQRLSELYRNANESFCLESYWTSMQRSLYRLENKSDVIFTGHDGLLINAQLVCNRLAEELYQTDDVRLHSNNSIDIAHDLCGTTLHIGSSIESYDYVVLATGKPADEGRSSVRKRYQVHLNVTPADSRTAALYPVLNMGDASVSWAVPSPDKSTVTISASAFSFTEEPDASLLKQCWDYLAGQIKFGYVRAERRVSVYYELPADDRKQTPYWRRDGESVFVLDACDGGLFKAAPALADELTAAIFEKDFHV